VKNYYIKIFILFIVFIQFFFKNTGKAQTQLQSQAAYTYVIINSELNTFGYDILDRGRVLIHQPNIPGMPGNKGFAKKKDAEKVARLVLNRVRKNIIPPTISIHELDSMHIINNK
jgi:hypothetical protein